MLRYQPTPHVLVARPYADVLLRTRKVASHLFVACSPKSRFFPPLVAYFAKVTLIPSFCYMFAEITRIPSTHTYTTTPHGAGVYYSHLFHVRRNHAFPTFSCMFAKFTLIPTFCCAKNCEICIFFAKLLQCSHFCCMLTMFAKITLIPTFCCMFAEITCIPSTPKASRSS